MELRPFGTLTIVTDPDGLFLLGTTSAGKRIIQELKSVQLDGRVQGTMVGKAAADWLTVDDDGNVTLDIRVLLIQTDDGAQVYVHLDGRAQWPERLGDGPIYSRATLEAGDERYAWVNHLPLVSKGAVAPGGGVAHELFELGRETSALPSEASPEDRAREVGCHFSGDEVPRAHPSAPGPLAERDPRARLTTRGRHHLDPLQRLHDASRRQRLGPLEARRRTPGPRRGRRSA